MEKIILKLGGSIITKKDGEIPAVNEKNLANIAKQIGKFYRNNPNVRLIIVHGAGSFGHQIANKTGIHNGIKTKKQLIDFAETQRLQNQLNLFVTEKLIKNQIPAMPIQASASAIMSKKALVHMATETIEKIISIGIVPVLYGVPAYDEVQKCSVLSGDEIAPYLAKKLKFNKIIHATNTDGVFTADPFKNKNAMLIKKINNKNYNNIIKGISASKSLDVTGGMLKKITELRKISRFGIKSQIINGVKKENIFKALSGDNAIGTTFE